MVDLYPLIEENSGETYIIVENWEGKVWAFPQKYIRTGMNIYQPSAWKGKLLKCLLPLYPFLPFEIENAGIYKKRLLIDNKFRPYLEKMGLQEHFISIFYGSPGPNRKTTVQVFDDKEIKTYIKVASDWNIYKFFMHEDKVLDYLNQCGMKNIPKSLGVTKLDNKYIFEQTSLKKGNSKIQYQIQQMHWEFLQRLYCCTKKELLFEDSDFYAGFTRIECITNILGEDEKEFLAEAIELICFNYKEKKMNFSLYHGDFTPWNTIVKKNELYVFDFEYACYTYIPYMDIFHFYTQTQLFIEHAAQEDIWKKYCILRENWGRKIENQNSDIVYMAYLIDIIMTYKSLQMDTDISIDAEKYNVWFYLLSKLINCCRT